MASDTGISELLLRWRELQQQGKQISAEEVCADHPELVEELKRRLELVQAMERRLGAGLTGADSRATADSAAMPTGGILPAAADPFLIPGYELLGVLDQGGMGIVYKARQLRLKRLVAVKMIRADAHARPQQRARFRVEAEAVARLQHPNIVQIYEVGEVEDRPYFSMEFVEGGSLAQQLAGRPMPPRQAAELVATLADAIHFAHQRGVIHRDLKPANVLLQIADCGLQIENHETSQLPDADLGAVGQSTIRYPLSTMGESAIRNPQSAIPKISDFGLAKRLDVESNLSGPGSPTQSGVILGTPSYMSPEQAEGKTREIGPLADVYALGAILYELLVGRPPFVGNSALDTLLRVVSAPPAPPSLEQPRVPRDLETICLKCLEKAPAARYPSAAALADDLRRFVHGLPITAQSLSLPRRAVKWAKRKKELTLPLAMLLAVGLGLAGFAWQRHRAHQEEIRLQEEEVRETAIRLAPRVREILHEYCYQCHGQDPKRTEGKLDVLNYAQLLDPRRKLVVPGDFVQSHLIHRIDDGSMPPEEEEEFPRLSVTGPELADLKAWVVGGAPPFPDEPISVTPPPPPSKLAIDVKRIFRDKCHTCHRFGNAKQGIKVLNYDLLVAKRKVVVPGRPQESKLFDLLTIKDEKKLMPPLGEDPLTDEEIETIRRWIAEGAPAFPRALAAKP